MHGRGFATVTALMLVGSLIVGVSPTEAKGPQELEADIASLHAALRAQQAKINQLEATLQAQQAQINQRVANESAVATMLIQWDRALETWKGNHFIYTPVYQNNVFSFH